MATPVLGAFSGNRRAGPGFLNFLGYLYNFQCGKKYFAPSGPMPKEMSLRRKVETGYFMFRLYLLKYLFVGGWGTEITDILMPKILRQ